MKPAVCTTDRISNMFPILGGRLLKPDGWNSIVEVYLFPILGGRLLKLTAFRVVKTQSEVSNPWREAIEGDKRNFNGKTNRSFQSLEGGY